jgi:UDP-glucose 4-epimerase
MIAAFCEGFGMQTWIFRFVSILGERYSHGHVFDFYRSLLTDPTRLRVLGNGKQRKSYLYVADCVDAILLAMRHAQDRVNILNLGTDEYCEVNDSIRWITGQLNCSPELAYSGTERGWIGDSPFIFLDCSRVRALGWRPRLTIQQGILKTLDYLVANPWLVERRA